MTVEFKLPDLGEGIHEAEIIGVKVKEGENVKEDQPIFEVETDKAVVEIPSPYAGIITKIFVSPGQTVTVGSVMVAYDIGGAEPANQAKTAALAESATESSANSKATSTKESTQKSAMPAAPARELVASGNGKHSASASTAASVGAVVDRSRPIPAAPAIRRLARELNVDLYLVRASGPAGRVTREDVMAYAAGSLESRIQDNTAGGATASRAAEAGTASAPRSSAASMAEKFGGGGDEKGGGPLNFAARAAGQAIEYPDFAKFGKVERMPLKSIRRKIAQSMTQSWTHIPHVTTFDEANVTDLSKMISKYEKEYAERSGNPKVRPTMTVFVLKAVASALQRFPQFNSSLDENSGEIVVKHYFNLGVAVATERGLIVPVIKNINEKSFYEVAVELADIAAKTRSGKIELDRLQGGTFTVTNIGAIGGTGAAPMINFPEAAILGMARAAEKPIVKNGNIEVGTILPIFMSFDHRLADGAEAAYFVQHVVKLLEDPFKFVLDI
ncbi:MAG: 2-oxo acid dehydrogenase subunit E2 [Cyanobacteria bacterium REEB67]|nr:2-oxo acid dehydrogenase subunit E2 [Cyanobacteria bacterium REEB67]